MAQKTEISNAVALAVNAKLSAITAKADNAIAHAGARCFVELGEFFGTTSEAELLAATTPAKVGIPSKTPDGKPNREAVRLSQYRACYRVYRDARAQFDAIAAADLKGWNAIMAEIREVVKSLKAERAEERITEEAAKVAKVQHRDDPVAQEKAAEVYAQQLRDAKAAEQQERKAERESVPGVTKRIAAMLIKEFGLEFARDVSESLPDMIDAVYKAKQEEAAEA